MTRARTIYRALATTLLIYSVGVILFGAFVRATGSGAGCGSHWPTCDGAIVPVIETEARLIELTHRVTSGLAWVLAAGLAVVGWLAFPRRDAGRRAGGLVLLFMTTEALVGAAIVLLELVADDASAFRAGWMALHLVNTFLLLGALTAAVYVGWDGPKISLRVNETRARVFGGILFGILVVGATGAVTALGDTLFPSTSVAGGWVDDLSPTAHFLIRLRIIHPVLAIALALFLVTYGVRLANAALSWGAAVSAWALVGITTLQIGLGFANVALLAPIWLQLVHLAVSDLLWIATLICGAMFLRDEGSITPAAVPEAPASSACNVDPETI